MTDVTYAVDGPLVVLVSPTIGVAQACFVEIFIAGPCLGTPVAQDVGLR